ncbi:hypothetical protein KO504_08510 [Winogradskyella psychrotolerans]|uniref:hypothetical protein n=1 Tax=Winogradskyella psychrotolerans TaxID=1344585 RepID=UPI001C077342|nr:hypothetical protein [Winogradskyella psychrotolerans]MBU2921381.1 hypothetical protein [Winogradskyella psychrotolerans]
MKNTFLIIFLLFISLNAFSQRNRDIGRIPQATNEPTEQEIATREREVEERKDEYINNFLSTLEGDEFQKHITKQTIVSFFDAKLAILKIKYEHYLDRKAAIEHLEKTHFTELKELISESDMTKITEMIKGEFDEKEVVKKKKEKRKKKKRRKNKD